MSLSGALAVIKRNTAGWRIQFVCPIHTFTINASITSYSPQLLLPALQVCRATDVPLRRLDPTVCNLRRWRGRVVCSGWHGTWSRALGRREKPRSPSVGNRAYRALQTTNTSELHTVARGQLLGTTQIRLCVHRPSKPRVSRSILSRPPKQIGELWSKPFNHLGAALPNENCALCATSRGCR